MAAGFIKEVFHPEWLANPVLVKKKCGNWRMCVDYTGLNKACPKVPYPLPRIDQIVDSTAGCETLSFLDAYSGYHQIKMKESDQLATSFITPFGMYCYTTMPFGLRNVGATYQRCMNHVFEEHIDRTVEAYVDDIVVKTRKASDLLSDLEVTFRCLSEGRKIQSREVCLRSPPRHAPRVHRLRTRHRGQPGENRSHHQHGTHQKFKRSTKGHGMPCGSEPLHLAPWRERIALVPPLKEGRALHLDSQGRRSPLDLKALLTNAPILVPPAAGEALLIYVAATTHVVSATVVVERREEGHALLIQRPVYFISEVLSETKICYPQIQKLLYAVILTRRKSRHYFESHLVTVVSSFHLGEIIQC
jgi:hypothetical protein